MSGVEHFGHFDADESAADNHCALQAGAAGLHVFQILVMIQSTNAFEVLARPPEFIGFGTRCQQ